MNDQNIIVFSGLPATGKSAAIRELKNTLSNQFFFLPEFLETYPADSNQQGVESLPQAILSQEWVIRQHYLKLELAKRMYPRPVIMDRTYIDALAFGWAFSEELFWHSKNYVDNFSWQVPDVIFFKASLAVIKSRFMKREGINEELWHTQWKVFMNRLTEGYEISREICNINYITISAEKELPTVIETIHSKLMKE